MCCCTAFKTISKVVSEKLCAHTWAVMLNWLSVAFLYAFGKQLCKIINILVASNRFKNLSSLVILENVVALFLHFLLVQPKKSCGSFWHGSVIVLPGLLVKPC